MWALDGPWHTNVFFCTHAGGSVLVSSPKRARRGFSHGMHTGASVLVSPLQSWLGAERCWLWSGHKHGWCVSACLLFGAGVALTCLGETPSRPS